MSDRPPGRPRDKAEALLKVQPVDLVDHTIDIIIELGTAFLDAVIDPEKLFHGFTAFHQRIDLKAPGFQLLDHAELGVFRQLAHLAPGISEEPQRAGGRDFGFQLAQRARRRVARVGENLAAIGCHALVQRLKILVRHIDFAAHFNDARHRAGQLLRNILDRLRVLGDVFTCGAVTSRCGVNQSAVFIPKRQRQTVDLRLRGNCQRPHQRIELQKPAHAADEVPDVVIVEGIVQRQHRHPVSNLAETGRRGRPYLGRGTVFKNEIGKPGLDGRVPPAQRVIVRIRDHRGIFLVIAAVMLGDFRRQPFQLDLCFLLRQGVDVGLGEGSVSHDVFTKCVSGTGRVDDRIKSDTGTEWRAQALIAHRTGKTRCWSMLE